MTLSTDAGTEKQFRDPANLSIALDINASPERVFAVLCDIERWPEWTSTVSSVQRLDDAPLSVGSRAKVLQPSLRPAIWHVTEIEAARNFTWATRSPGVRVMGRHLVQKTAAGSRVTLTIEFTGLLRFPISRLFRKLNERYIAIEAEGLKRRSEDALS